MATALSPPGGFLGWWSRGGSLVYLSCGPQFKRLIYSIRGVPVPVPWPSSGPAGTPGAGEKPARTEPRATRLTQPSSTNRSDEMTWDKVQAQAAALNAAKFAGYSDWRLPTVKELYSLVTYAGNDPSASSMGTVGLVPFLPSVFYFNYGNATAGRGAWLGPAFAAWGARGGGRHQAACKQRQKQA